MTLTWAKTVYAGWRSVSVCETLQSLAQASRSWPGSMGWSKAYGACLGASCQHTLPAHRWGQSPACAEWQKNPLHFSTSWDSGVDGEPLLQVCLSACCSSSSACFDAEEIVGCTHSFIGALLLASSHLVGLAQWKSVPQGTFYVEKRYISTVLFPQLNGK